MNELRRRFKHYCGCDLDISEHLGLLRGLAMDPHVGSIVEIGFRDGVSATALATADKPLTCYDIDPCKEGKRSLGLLAPRFRFIQADSLKIEIPTCELLHIDSLHTYKHLLAELRLHAHNSLKWIALHDTVTFANDGKDGTKPGLQAAINQFLDESRDKWKHFLTLTNNNGMTLLRRL